MESDTAESSSAPSNGSAFKARKVYNKSVRTTVVKCGLSGSLKEPALRPLIHDLVRYTSEAFHRVGLVLTYVINSAITKGEGIVPDMTNQTFIDRAVRLNDSARAAEPALREEWDDVFYAYPEPVRPRSTGTIAAQSARSGYKTNIENCLVHAFEKRQAAYIRARCKLDGIWNLRWKLVQRLINGRNVKTEEKLSLTLEEVALVGQERRLLGLDWDRASRSGADKVTESWRKSNADTVWRAYHRWLTVLEALDHEKGFAMVPMPKIRASHIAIDTTLLHAMMTQAELINVDLKAFTAQRDIHWHSAFKLIGLRSNRFAFAHLVKSDGVSLSVHFQAPRTAKEEAAHSAADRWAKKLAAIKAARLRRDNDGVKAKVPGPLSHLGPGDRVITIDPGKTNIMLAVEVLADGTLLVTKLTRAQYYAESGMKQAIAQSIVWNEQVERQQRSVNVYSVKTTDMDQFKAHVAALARVHEDLWEQRTRPCMARQRFGTWSGRAKALDAYFKRLQG